MNLYFFTGIIVIGLCMCFSWYSVYNKSVKLLISLVLIITAITFFQTVVSLSPYAGFVGGSLCDAEEELGVI